MKLIDKINQLIDSNEQVAVTMPVYYLSNNLSRNSLPKNSYLYNFINTSYRGPIFNYNYQQFLKRNVLSFIKNQISWDSLYKEFTASEYKRAVQIIKPLIRETEVSFFVKFTRDLNWKKGTYGDSNSCWFGTKSGARKMVLSHNGFAVQVHLDNSSRSPYGRCWGVVMEPKSHSTWFQDIDYKDTIVLFNGYTRSLVTPITRQNTDSLSGMMYTNSYADMVAAALNIKFGVNVKLTNNRYTSSGNFFINQEYGVLLSNKKVKFSGNNRRIELAYKEEEWAKCRYCDRILGQDMIETPDGRIFCMTCADERLEMCCYDMQVYDRQDMVYGPDQHLYFSGNILKVSNFVSCFISGDVIFKSPESYLGLVRDKEVYINPYIISNYKICSCGNSVIRKDSPECLKCYEKNKKDTARYKIKFSDWLSPSGTITNIGTSSSIVWNSNTEGEGDDGPPF